jgi:uncharacterized protein (TIGR03437 family)
LILRWCLLHDVKLDSVRYRAFLLLALAAPAWAQFTSFSTNYDGSKLFFTTRLVQPGTNQPAHGKIFVIDPNRVTPLFVSERIWYPSDPTGGGVSNLYDAIAVSIDGQAEDLAATLTGECNFGSPCVSNDLATSSFYDGAGNELFSFRGGRTKLSPNGRWALIMTKPVAFWPTFAVTRRGETPIPVPVGSTQSAVLDAHAIADDGTAVIASGGYGSDPELVIFTPPASFRRIKANAVEASIDAAGTTVVWSELQNDSRTLRLYRMADGNTTTLQAPATASKPKLSQDGRRLLYLAEGQAWIVDLLTNASRQVTSAPEGVTMAELSGNGNVVWFETTLGRVVQLDLDTRSERERIGRTPAFTTTDPLNVAAGQPVTLRASVDAGDDVRVELDGAPVPMLRVDSGTITFQIPWEAKTTGITHLGLIASDANHWHGATVPTYVNVFTPAFEVRQVARGEISALAAHQNFDTLITATNPATPGEIVHLYAKGLGLVNPPVATGQPAPSSPLSRITLPMTCVFGTAGDSIPVEVLFAGLAPGTVGYYQVSLRMPQKPPTYDTGLRCVLEAPDGRGTIAINSVAIPMQR